MILGNRNKKVLLTVYLTKVYCAHTYPPPIFLRHNASLSKKKLDLFANKSGPFWHYKIILKGSENKIY